MGSSIRELFGDTQLEIQEAFELKHLEIQEGFQWLQEIVAEASNTIANNSPHLKQLPKTPGAKRKAQRKVKREVIIEEEEETTEQLTKLKPSTLKFDIASAEDEEDVEKPKRARPTRKGSRQATVNSDTPKARNTRASRKAVTKPVEARPCTPVLKIDPGTPEVLSVVTATVLNSVSDLHVKHTKLSVSAKSSDTDVNSQEDQSPCVKERATAYETMLQHRNSVSPVKVATPNSMNRKRSSQRLSRSGKVCLPVHSGKPALAKRSVESENKKARSSGRQASTSNKKKPAAKKPTRTRLRLKKQTGAEDQITSSESAESLIAKIVIDRLPTPVSASKKVSDAISVEMLSSDDENNCKAMDTADTNATLLDVTQTLVTEVFEINPYQQTTTLKEYEKMSTKTTPVLMNLPSKTSTGKSRAYLSSDQGFNDGDEDGDDEDDDVDITDSRSKVMAAKCCRTYTRKKKSSAVVPARVSEDESEEELMETDIAELAMQGPAACDSTFTKAPSPEPEEPVRSTRTRAKAGKPQPEQPTQPTQPPTSTPPGTPQRSTRTRARAQNNEVKETRPSGASSTSASPQRATRTRTRTQPQASEAPQEAAPGGTRTKTRAKKAEVEALLALPKTGVASKPPKPSAHLLSDDEIVASSPVEATIKARLGGGKKRLLEERGNSPRPKRSRSYMGDPNNVTTKSPLLSSSPIKLKGYNYFSDVHNDEAQDAVHALGSPKRKAINLNFSSAQSSHTTSFLNRTPGFNTSKVYSFLNTTPGANRSTSVLTSFLKRNTPTQTKTNQQIHQEKTKKLLEKEEKNKERMKKAADMRKKKIDEQKKQREERERKIAESREQRQRMEDEQKERINRKLEGNAALKVKLAVERNKEEGEKKKIRLKKQIEADARRKLEEEERYRKLLQQEEESKEQQEFMKRKREHEEIERRKRIEEESRREAERRAENEKYRQEEVHRLQQQEQERERERERHYLEKEQRIAEERVERERRERELREERERKCREELDKLKAMEQERHHRAAQESKAAAKESHKLQQLISTHNANLIKPTTLNTTQTLPNNTSVNSSNISCSYDLTPVKKKVFKVSTNPENYDIDDKGSDESTDDDQAPKKKIPEWASGTQLKSALIRQFTNPPDLEAIFQTEFIPPPDLQKFFPNVKRPRFLKRTSSAIWTSPVFKKGSADEMRFTNR